MIPVIDKGSYFKGLIDYNEEKVEIGQAELLLNNTLGNDRKGYNHDFLGTVAAKPFVKNPAVQIILSFAKEDKLDNEKLVELSQEYLREMGYGNSPFLIYRHFDTGHDHVHIVTSRVDYERKLVDGHKDFHRSRDLSRLMEEKHGLHKVIYRAEEEKQLSQINANRYTFHNGLKKAFKDPLLRAEVEPRVLTELVELVQQGQSISNSKAEMLYQSKGLIKDFIELNQFLKDNGLIKKLEKDELIDRLLKIKKQSFSYADFLDKALQDGLYVRVLEGKKQIVLGVKEKSFYLKDKQLPRDLRYMSLINIGKVKTEFTETEQKKYITFHLRKALKHSYRLEDFMNVLRRKGIETDIRQDARGIYGLSFKNVTMENGKQFKASELGSRKEFSVEKVLSALEQNAINYPSTVRDSYKNFVPNSYPVNLKRIAKAMDEQDSEEQTDPLKRQRGYGI